MIIIKMVEIIVFYRYNIKYYEEPDNTDNNYDNNDTGFKDNSYLCNCYQQYIIIYM